MQQNKIKGIAIDDLIKYSPDEILEFISLLDTKLKNKYKGFNFHLISETASSSFHTTKKLNEFKESITWLKVAIKINEFLRDISESETNKFRYDLLSINYIILGIKEFSEYDNNFFNTDKIIWWFEDSIMNRYSLTEVQKKVKIWQELDINEILALRNIKLSINLINDLISNCQHVEVSNNILEWLNIRNELP